MQTKINKLIHEHDATEEDIQSFKLIINNIKRDIKDILQYLFKLLFVH